MPGVGIGEFRLGMNFREIADMVKEYTVEERHSCDVIQCGDSSFFIDREKDTCFQIVAEGDFKGKFDYGIGIGSTLKDILHMGYKYFEDLDCYFIKDVYGIGFELDGEWEDKNWKPDEWDELVVPILYMSVFSEEFKTRYPKWKKPEWALEYRKNNPDLYCDEHFLDEEDLVDCLNENCQIEFLYGGKQYYIAYQKDKIIVGEFFNEKSIKLYSRPSQVLNYAISEKKIKEIISEMTILVVEKRTY
jgi:hypothetical protein